MKDTATTSNDFLKYRIAKGWQILPALAAKPSRIPWLLQGVSPGRMVSLDVEWLKVAGIQTVLDIGANVGQFAATMNHILPEAVIYSFEPLPDCYESMRLRMAGMADFHPYKLAIGGEDGMVDFQRNDFSQSSSVLPMAELHRDAFVWSAHSTTIQVQMARLDTVFKDVELDSKVLIKIDVQGFEDRVLRGGEHTVRSADIVMIETSMEPLYEGQPSFEQVYDIMQDYGFRYGGNVEQLTNPNDGRILQADALFLRR